MPTVVQLNRVIADATRQPLPTVRMMSRRLIDDDLLPKGTGRRVPKVTHEQTAMLLLAVMAGQPVKDATRTAQTYGALLHNGIGAGTALEVIASLLHSLPTDPLALEWFVNVCETFPQVVLKNKTIHANQPSHSERTDGGDLFIPKGEDRQQWPADCLIRNATLPGACLYAIARALAEDE